MNETTKKRKIPRAYVTTTYKQVFERHEKKTSLCALCACTASVVKVTLHSSIKTEIEKMSSHRETMIERRCAGESTRQNTEVHN